MTDVLLGHLTIDKLSDDVLLRIFDSYRRGYEGIISTRWWHALVHICERWRRIIFACPGHLNLQLVCKSKTDMKTTLDIWPALPISIQASFYEKCADEDDIIGALENRDRIAGINFGGLTRSKLEKCVALMQQSFPVLSSLHLSSTNGGITCVIPDAFLGGSAPRLKSVLLSGIRFPALPKLLSSARDLVNLDLGCFSIDDISLEAMVTSLSVLTKLQSLTIRFNEISSPDPTGQSPTSLIPTVLPALTDLSLGGPYEYLETFVARIDAPRLDNAELAFDDEPIFDTARVPQFIHRTEMFKSLGGVDVYFYKEGAFREGCVILYLHPSIGPAKFELSFPCSGLPSQVALMERTWNQCQALLSHVESLQLHGDSLEEWKSHYVSWQGFFEPFTAVQTLHLSGEVLTPQVAGMLGFMEEEAIEVLPKLHTLVLECSEEVVFEADDLLEPFIVAREHSEHPVVVKREDW